ncbi:MAG: hypothetical protein MI755_18835 [Sphingomonadales bacterium]|nr:hypothetical protein [Sphingomonadales bacterium]
MPHEHRLGIVTGMVLEARLLTSAFKSIPADARPLVAASGPSRKRAHDVGHALAREGATALMSAGLAGALAPELETGDVIVADRLLTEDKPALACSPIWVAALADAGPPTPLYSAGVAVATAEEKRAVAAARGAAAVDMESYGVGAAAQELGLPFVALRAIADDAERAIPPAALKGLKADGNTDPWAVLTAMAASPGQIRGVLAVAGDSRKASKALRRVALALAPAFGLGDV